MTRWWKCDLQVATPGEPRFRAPAEGWNLSSEDGRAAAADSYMEAAKAAGLEVVVLADHNSVQWIDTMVEAGRRHSIVVFPGFEVTSATGSDGAHAILFGDPSKKASDLEQLLYGACGFNVDHPAFEPHDSRTPCPSPRTLPQIFDSLTDDYLAIAPHVFSENGLASKETVYGQLRWKALHHERLAAVDVGDASQLDRVDSFRARFVRRELSSYPCISRLAFVSTSDAYSLGSLGSRFTWIRMAEPTLEGMRQAFLDHEARIICDWDARYRGSNLTPNDVSHAWVQQVTLTRAGNVKSALSVALDPRLTVIIGGRGSGKSTVVAGLRCLYGDTNALPAQARNEAQQFEQAVFDGAVIDSVHRLPHSGEEQRAVWRPDYGSRIERPGGSPTPNSFRVRVVSQKELFERAANSPDDPHATSRNLLALVDDALSSSGIGAIAEFPARLDKLQTAWVNAARVWHSEVQAVAQKAVVRERVRELTGQVEAFDNEASKARRLRNDTLIAQERSLGVARAEVEAAIEQLRVSLRTNVSSDDIEHSFTTEQGDDVAELNSLLGGLNEVWRGLRQDIGAALAKAEGALGRWVETRDASDWHGSVLEAHRDAESLAQELAGLGLDPEAYAGVREDLQRQTEAFADLEAREARLPELRKAAESAWMAIEEIHHHRHHRRAALLDEIADRSQILRFALGPGFDTTSWVEKFRKLVGLRVDGYVEEIPALANWLWRPHPERETRHERWRAACVSGDFTSVVNEVGLRSQLATRLRTLDPLVRARAAAEIADETVLMEFRRDTRGSGNSESWEALSSGSPGQRSTAMLSFILHHGSEPLVLDQPEDDLDTEWITELVVEQLRTSRWSRQLIVITHNANIPVNADAERVVVLENFGDGVRVRVSADPVTGEPRSHCGAIEDDAVRADIQRIMEGGVDAFVRRERRYNNELNTYRAAMQLARAGAQAR